MNHSQPPYRPYRFDHDAILGPMPWGQPSSAAEMPEWTNNQSSPIHEIPNSPTPDRREISGSALLGVYSSLSSRETAKHYSCLQGLYSWTPEIICCLIGITAMIGLYFSPLVSLHADLFPLAGDIIILIRVDGKPQPKFSLGLTINALVELITSIAKLFLAVPIVSGLGQLKWLWFNANAQPLTDFQLYEDASRGGLGSIRLLFRLRLLRKSSVIVSDYLLQRMLKPPTGRSLT
jgi:hypothetical protein